VGYREQEQCKMYDALPSATLGMTRFFRLRFSRAYAQDDKCVRSSVHTFPLPLFHCSIC
jgi:hypothetical protein